MSDIVLVDIDSSAVLRGVNNQWQKYIDRKKGEHHTPQCTQSKDASTFTTTVGDMRQRIHVLPSIDVTGIAEDMSSFNRDSTADVVAAAQRKAEGFRLKEVIMKELRRIGKNHLADNNGFDIVLSDLLFRFIHSIPSHPIQLTPMYTTAK